MTYASVFADLYVLNGHICFFNFIQNSKAALKISVAERADAILAEGVPAVPLSSAY